MKNYVYRIENQESKEFYLGVRSCECEIEKDPYLGSSSAWNKAYIKANKGLLVKTVVSTFETRTEANKAESDLIEEFILDALCVNRYIPKYYKDFMRRTASEETRRLQSINNTGERNPFYGKTHTEEFKQKKAEERKGSKSSEETKQKLSVINTGEGNRFYGWHHTEEFKKKKSEERKGKYTGSENSFYGKTHTEETKQKLRELKLGKHSNNNKPIQVVDTITSEKWVFNSLTEMRVSKEFPGTGPEKALRANRLYLKKYLINYAD